MSKTYILYPKRIDTNVLDWCICWGQDFSGYSTCGLDCPVHDRKPFGVVTPDIVDGITMKKKSKIQINEVGVENVIRKNTLKL